MNPGVDQAERERYEQRGQGAGALAGRRGEHGGAAERGGDEEGLRDLERGDRAEAHEGHHQPHNPEVRARCGV